MHTIVYTIVKKNSFQTVKKLNVKDSFIFNKEINFVKFHPRKKIALNLFNRNCYEAGFDFECARIYIHEKHSAFNKVIL